MRILESPARRLRQQHADQGRARSRTLARVWAGRRIDPLTACVVVATAIFALGGIGAPLLGLRVFADPGSLAQYSGYRDVLAGVTVQAENQRDITDNVLPIAQLFHDALWQGEYATWDPYPLTGEPLGSLPNSGLSSPLSLPYWLLPTWLAPGYVKLLELVVAIGGMVLFLRRLALGRAAAWLGGIAFASSAFMVVWTNWPQTRVAAFIPALFWAVERIAASTRELTRLLREVSLLALVVAAMLLGGFPSVTGYALLTAAVYALVRLAAQYGGDLRTLVAKLGAAGAGVLAGLGLTAVQLVPWAQFMRTVYIEGRQQDLTQHLPYEALLTAVAPFALGTANPAKPPTWFAGLEIIAANSYVGAAVLVLAIAALALARRARAALPGGCWGALVGTATGWTIVIYFGGPLLWLLQQTGFLFTANFVGRARSVLGFLIATLAAVGFDVLVRRRREAQRGVEPAQRRARVAYGVGIWLCFIAGGVGVYLAARRLAAMTSAGRAAHDPPYPLYLDGQVTVAVLLMLAAALAMAWLWFGPRRTRWHRRLRQAAALALVLLVAGQALAWVGNYYPRTDKADFYPSTATQRYLAEHLDHERYFGADGAIYGSVDVGVRLRSLHGHGFLERHLAELVDTLPGKQFSNPSTAIISPQATASIAAVSPVLDRAAVDYFVAPPQVQPFGPVVLEHRAGRPIPVQSGQTLRFTALVPGPLRGVGLTPVSLGDAAPTGAQLRVTLRDRATGAVIASGVRDHTDVRAGRPWVVALPAEAVRRGTSLQAEIEVRGAPGMTLAPAGDRPALVVIDSDDDGLRLVYAAETVIYQRLGALPRARWAAHAMVVPDAAARIDLLGHRRLDAGTVVLDEPAQQDADGKPAEVTWVNDGLSEMELSVRADGAGYLVLADAIQHGWRVSVDGEPARLLNADHAFVAVAVPAGEHTVRFWYPSPLSGPGAWVTLATALVLLGAYVGPAWRRRRGVPEETTKG